MLPIDILTLLKEIAFYWGPLSLGWFLAAFMLYRHFKNKDNHDKMLAKAKDNFIIEIKAFYVHLNEIQNKHIEQVKSYNDKHTDSLQEINDKRFDDIKGVIDDYNVLVNKTIATLEKISKSINKNPKKKDTTKDSANE